MRYKGAMGFRGYLRVEAEVAERSRTEYESEVAAFAELTDLFDRLAAAVKIKERRCILPAELFLVVANQMCGSGSLMLRTRREDALAATRRAIEATAVAYRVWEHPELADVYVKAYPHAGDPRHPRQSQPDRRYVREFKTANLFAPEGPTNTWYTLLTAYMEMLKVFIRMLRGNAPSHVMDILGQELLAWRDRTAVVADTRAPWMRETVSELYQGRPPASPEERKSVR